MCFEARLARSRLCLVGGDTSQVEHQRYERPSLTGIEQGLLERVDSCVEQFAERIELALGGGRQMFTEPDIGPGISARSVESAHTFTQH